MSLLRRLATRTSALASVVPRASSSIAASASSTSSSSIACSSSFTSSSASTSAFSLQSFRRFGAHAAPAPKPEPSIPLTFVTMDGQRFQVKAIEGETLLNTADRHGLPIPGTCLGGGNSRDVFGEGPMCSTCHIYVDNEHVATLPPKGEDEEIITRRIRNANANSRFACEIIADKSISGMVIIIPDYPDRA